MRFVKAGPNEFLVTGRRGRVRNRGTAASALLWPGTSFVRIPSTKQEARFELTQESKDGVPLRFKGIVIYRVVEPVVAARHFDFAGGAGHAQIQGLLADICLGELRALVSHLTMAECVEGRKTTLSGAIAATLAEVVGGGASSESWGLALEVVQVAQVFIVDAELRRQLEAEVRDAIKAQSQRSELRASEEIKLARLASERRLQQDGLESERERAAIAEEKLRLEHGLAREKERLERELERQGIEAEEPVRKLRLERDARLAREALGLRRLENELAALEAEGKLILPRAEQELRRAILPLEQRPELARALAGLLRGARLSLYGAEALPLARALEPLLALVSEALGEPRVT